MVNVPPGFCRAPKYNDHHRRTVIFIIAILRRFTPIAVRAFALLTPAILAAVLFAIPASEARAHDDNSATLHAETHPLHEAVKAGDLNSVNHFITVHMTDVNAKSTYGDGDTPLHLAAYGGSWSFASIASILLVAGANVNAKNKWGRTPLWRTVYGGSVVRERVASILLTAGGHWGKECASPLLVNPSSFHPPCVCPFHPGNDAGTSAKCPADHAPINHRLDSMGGAILAENLTLVLHFISQHGSSPHRIGYAINAGPYSSPPPLRAIKTLIERGADVDDKFNGNTPLHLAARKPETPENVALVSLLLDKGANPNLENRHGWRPLDYAVDHVAWGEVGYREPRSVRRKIMSALINGGANWRNECSGGAIPNEHYRGETQVAIYPQCICPAHIDQRDDGGACKCPAYSHSQVNGLCLPKDSPQVEDEIAKMQVELARLRAALVSLNARLSLSAEAPRETVEDIAEQARKTAAEIDWRRANFVALGRRAEAGEAPPPVALSDTAAECRMRGGEVRIDSGSGTRICLGLDQSGTFCLVDSGDVFSCRGLFKHVRRCNDVYHRPALNAFICAARCDVDETARGRGCE